MTGTTTLQHLAYRLPDGTLPSARVLHLIEAARREFMASGFDAVSIDGLARLTGVSKETIYRHFPDKAALLRAALAGLRASFEASAASVGREAKDPEAILTGYAQIIQDATLDGGFLSATWLSIAIARAVPDIAGALQNDSLTGLEPLRLKLAKFAAEAGIVQPVPIELAADFGSLADEGARSLMRWEPSKAAERTQNARRVSRLLLHGCSAGKAPVTPLSAFVMADGNWGGLKPPSNRAPHIALLLEVARDHFFAHGYQGVSLDDIGSIARVGRGTLYRHFRNKAGVFEASMLDAAERLSCTPPPLRAECEPAAALAPFLAAASATLTSSAAIALHRTVIAESRRNPELARQIYIVIREPWHAALAEWLARKVEVGVLELDDPAWHAMQLLTLATAGNRPFAANDTPDAAARALAVRRAIAIFLGGYMAALC